MRPESTIDQLMKRKANRAVACSDRQVVQCSDPGSVYDNIKRSFSTLSALQLIQVVCSLFIVLSITLMTEAEASCFLSYDSAQVSAQGDGLARLSLHGGSEGLGAHLEGRLGLPGDRSVHLRTGSCERQGLWGWGVEAGLNQEWLSQADTGLVDLAFRLSATMLIADDEENAYSAVGMQPVFLISYPFSLERNDRSIDSSVKTTKDSLNERQGFIGMSLGMSAYFIDQRQRRITEDGVNQLEVLKLSSEMEWQPLIALSGSVDIIPLLPLSLEVRWQQQGLYGGAAIGYQF